MKLQFSKEPRGLSGATVPGPKRHFAKFGTALLTAVLLPLAAGCVKEKPTSSSAQATQSVAKIDARSHLDSCLARILGAGGRDGVLPLGDEDLKDLFVKYPDAFVRIAEAAKEGTRWAFYVVEQYDVSRKFARSPDSVVGPLVWIGNAAGENKGCAYKEIRVLGYPFARNPDAFLQIARAAGKETCKAFMTLETPASRERFSDYCDKKIQLDELVRYVVR